MKPMKEEDLSEEERKNIIGFCIFLKEKFDANRTLRKMNARLISDRRAQD